MVPLAAIAGVNIALIIPCIMVARLGRLRITESCPFTFIYVAATASVLIWVSMLVDGGVRGCQLQVHWNQSGIHCYQARFVRV